jgi:hypothetical protein
MNNNSTVNTRQSKRQKVLNSNVSNGNTPNFKNNQKLKSYYCGNCKSNFSYPTVQKFIKFHALKNEGCKSFLFKCGPQCEKKWFFTKNDLQRHHSQSKFSSYCNEYYRSTIIPKLYGESSVKISKSICDLPRNEYYQETTKMNLYEEGKSPILSSLQFINDGISNKIDNDFGLKTASHINPQILVKCHLYNQLLCSPINEDNTEVTRSIDPSQIHSTSETSENNEEFDIAHSENSSIIDHNSVGSYMDDSNSVIDEHGNIGETAIDINQNDIIDINESNLVSENIINRTQEIQIIIPQQSTISINSSNHFLNMEKIYNKEISVLNYDTDYMDSLKLVQLLLKKKMSLSNYKDFMTWKYNNKHHSPYSMQRLIETSSQRVYGQSLAMKLKPKINHMICPSGRRINLMTMDLDASIYDMLSCPILTSIPNTIFEDGNEENPFHIKESNYYGDVHECEYYTETMKKLNIDTNTDLLVPIQLYLDETNLDQYGNISLHPVVITLLIYNRSTRNLSMSWRTIAYLPNFDIMFQQCKYTVEEKVGDFHFCLRYILNGLEKLQNIDGMFWDFKFDKYPGKVYRRKLKFPLATVLGDAKGLDLLCSRFGNRTKTVCIARDCNVKTEESDDPHVRCTFHKQKDLESMTSQELQQLSFRKITPYNAFSKINMGANIYGINGCSPADPCHQFNKGPVERLPTIFISRLTTKMGERLDAHVGALSTKFGNQSDRDYPNIKRFSKGISTEAKLRSDDNLGRVMIIYLVLVTRDFEKEIVGKKGRKPSKHEPATVISMREYNSWVAIFEDTLILSSWVYLDKHPKEVFKGGKNCLVSKRIKKYMDLYLNVANRKEGMGLKLLKFHQLLHYWWIVRMYGSLHNVDTARCESHHKKKKQIGSHTQQRVIVMDEQTANDEYIFNLLLKAMDQAGMDIPNYFETTHNKSNERRIEEPIMETNTFQSGSQGSKFVLTFDYNLKIAKAKWTSYSLRGKQVGFRSHVLQSMYDKFESYNHGKVGYRIKSIDGFTEHRLQNHKNAVLRACPNYRNDKDWFDWVNINWGDDEGLLEGQCLMFLDFNTIKLEPNLFTNEIGMNVPHNIMSHGKTVLLHSTTDDHLIRTRPFLTNNDNEGSRISMVDINEGISNTNGNRCNDTDLLITRLIHFRNMETTYQLVSFDSMDSPCFVVIDESISSLDMSLPGGSKTVISLMRKDEWHFNFLDYSDNDMLLEASLNEDSDIESDDERYPFEG